jgi:hypothetical protein
MEPAPASLRHEAADNDDWFELLCPGQCKGSARRLPSERGKTMFIGVGTIVVIVIIVLVILLLRRR